MSACEYHSTHKLHQNRTQNRKTELAQRDTHASSLMLTCRHMPGASTQHNAVVLSCARVYSSFGPQCRPAERSLAEADPNTTRHISFYNAHACELVIPPLSYKIGRVHKSFDDNVHISQGTPKPKHCCVHMPVLVWAALSPAERTSDEFARSCCFVHRMGSQHILMVIHSI